MTPFLVPAVILALGVAASIALSLAVRREARILTRRNARKIDDILIKLDQAAETAGHPTPQARPKTDTSRRLEALRLLRRGETPSHVAAALGIRPAELELLVRVQKLSAAATRRPN